jgi:DNA-binding transcriptional ArsR family regulator
MFERLSRDGEMAVRVLSEHAGVSQPAVSKHLNQLQLAGLVRDCRSGDTHYRIEPRGVSPPVNWRSHNATCWQNRVDRLENLLSKMGR